MELLPSLVSTLHSMPCGCYFTVIHLVGVSALLDSSPYALAGPFGPGSWYRIWLLVSSLLNCGSFTLSVSGSDPSWTKVIPLGQSPTWALTLLLGQSRSPGSLSLVISDCGPTWALALTLDQLKPPASLVQLALPWVLSLAVVPADLWPLLGLGSTPGAVGISRLPGFGSLWL